MKAQIMRGKGAQGVFDQFLDQFVFVRVPQGMREEFIPCTMGLREYCDPSCMR